MDYNTKIVPAAEFAAAYGLDNDGDRLTFVVQAMVDGKSIFHHQRTDTMDHWLEDFARIVHESSLRFKDDPVVYVTDPDEFLDWVGRSGW